jgi:hypothetical protein
MALGPCDEIFFTTYWGTRRGLSYRDGYEGDLLFHIDPYQRTLVAHGLVESERGIPALASSPEHGVLYALAVEPASNRGTFLVMDIYSGEIIFSADASPGYRAIAVDGSGNAYFSSDTGELSVYDPTTNSIVNTLAVPGAFLRAHTTTADGSIVAVSQDPSTFNEIDGDNAVSFVTALDSPRRWP